jgi:hypothetical protein
MTPKDEILSTPAAAVEGTHAHMEGETLEHYLYRMGQTA